MKLRLYSASHMDMRERKYILPVILNEQISFDGIGCIEGPIELHKFSGFPSLLTKQHDLSHKEQLTLCVKWVG